MQSVSNSLLGVPWSSFPSKDEDQPLLLVKAAQPSTTTLHLTLLVTDLQECYFESLNERQMRRRVEQATVSPLAPAAQPANT